MGQDPAFLFYPGDWMGGTVTFSRAHKGAYMDLLMAQFNYGHMTLDDIKHILGSDFDLMWEQKLKQKFEIDSNGCFYNKKLEDEKQKRKGYVESRRASRTKCDEDNVRIYLLIDLDSNFIKIGSSVNPLRRYNEIANQTVSVVGSSENRNYKLLWFSEPTVRTMEKEIHVIFSKKRISGEWFDLDDDDISTIKRLFERTSSRTENENIINSNINNNSTSKGRKTTFPENFSVTPEMIEWALSQGIKNIEEIEKITDHFRDDRISKGERYARWDLAWKTWVRNHIKFSKKGGGNHDPDRNNGNSKGQFTGFADKDYGEGWG